MNGTMKSRTIALLALALAAAGCGGDRATSTAPCFQIQGSTELRTKDAAKVLAGLAARITLSPEDEALRHPKSLEDVKTILRRDVVYLFPDAAAFARSTGSVQGRLAEAQLELLLGESQLVASQVLAMQAAWVSSDLRIARASLATSDLSDDRERMLAQLIRVVEEGNAVADALGAVGPSHVARGAEVTRALEKEAAADPWTHVLVAELHRLRGEWARFDAAMAVAEREGREGSAAPALGYLRAMEQLERRKRPDRGATILRETLAAFPRFVRAQAALVLMAPNTRAAVREVTRLRQMNPDHYLVALLEPTLAAEQELLRLQGNDLPPDAGP